MHGYRKKSNKYSKYNYSADLEPSAFASAKRTDREFPSTFKNTETLIKMLEELTNISRILLERSLALPREANNKRSDKMVQASVADAQEEWIRLCETKPQSKMGRIHFEELDRGLVVSRIEEPSDTRCTEVTDNQEKRTVITV